MIPSPAATIRTLLAALFLPALLPCAAPVRAASELKDNPDRVLRAIENAVRDGDLERGIGIATQAIRQKPAAPHHLARAGLHALQGNGDAALQDFTAAVTLDPAFAEAWNQRGVFLLEHGEAAAAVADFDRAIALDEKQARTFLDRGKARLILGQGDAALDDFSTAVLVDPRDADAWTQRAEAHLGRHDWDAAISDCTVALELHPKKVAALNHRGSAWLAKQALQKALADFDAALVIDPHTAMALPYRAQIHRLRGELFRALEDVNQAIRFDANSASSFNERASIRAALGDVAAAAFSYVTPHHVAAAISDCNTALLVGGQNAATLLLRGMLSMQRADYRRAREDFDAVVKAGGELATPARIHLAWLLATCPDGEIRDGARASRLAHEAGARAPQEDPAIFDALAAAQAELGDFAAALETGHQAIATTAENRPKELNARRARIDLYLSGKPCRLPTAASASP